QMPVLRKSTGSTSKGRGTKSNAKKKMTIGTGDDVTRPRDEITVLARICHLLLQGSKRWQMLCTSNGSNVSWTPALSWRDLRLDSDGTRHTARGVPLWRNLPTYPGT